MDKNYREDFPILNGPHSLVYFDSAATTLKPASVITAVTRFYTEHTANISRSHHRNAQISTELFEDAREKVATLLNCDSSEIVFTQNATDSVNLVASCLSCKMESQFIMSTLEHNSAYLPFKINKSVKFVNLDANGFWDLNHFKDLLTHETKLVVVSHVSNVTGNIQPLKDIISLAKEKNALVLVDASQSIAHLPINVKNLDVDFLVFSGHKMLGPSGIGVLYGKKDLLSDLQHYRVGGGMTARASRDTITFNDIPHLFEAGTPNIEGVLGLGKACEYLLVNSREKIHKYLQKLRDYFQQKLKHAGGVRMLHEKHHDSVPIFTFELGNKNVDLNYVARILSENYNIAVNSGMQCAHLFYDTLKKSAGIRVSLYIYNTQYEIDQFFYALSDIQYLIE